MFDYQPGSQATLYLGLEEEGVGVAGATIGVTVTAPDGEPIIVNGVPDYQGDGLYSYQLLGAQTLQTGTYFVVWVVSAPFEKTERTTFTVGWTSAYPMTLLEMRHKVARLVEGPTRFLKGTVEGYDGPDVNNYAQIVDHDRLEAPKALRGWELYFYSGPAAGTKCRCLTNDGMASVTVTPYRTPVPVAGNRYEIHNTFGVEDYDEAIKSAVLEIPWLLIPIEYRGASFTSGTYLLDLPVGFSHVYDLRVQDYDNQWQPIAVNQWEVIRQSRQIKVDAEIVNGYAGRPILVYGFRRPQVPVADDSGIDVDLTFVTARAAATVASMGDPKEYGQKAAMQMQIAQATKAGLRTATPPNTRRVD